ncbi:MAG: VOC family protein [Betaproteobacteria bacterium]|jgi:catechol 2,3-dioxygenase-like lactoylglutathione lyase family enzyme|nr:MAG: VOC family protein [Betaproteobacteria bacterium]
MKRMHVHVSVSNLEQSIGFYSKLFDAQPTVVEADYAKWKLDDPRVNFAISARGAKPGLDHLGIQVDSGGELQAIHDRLDAAGQAMLTQEATHCCYARSDKHWVTDPQGLAWETFHTLDSAPTYGNSRQTPKRTASCCAPEVPSTAAASCFEGK